MAARKMTFSVPEELAELLIRRVSARNRSHFLSEALEKSLKQEDEQIAEACRLINEDPDVKAIEEEWDKINDPIEEEWLDAPSR